MSNQCSFSLTWNFTSSEQRSVQKMTTTVYLILVATLWCLPHTASAFDMWEVFENENKIEPGVQHDPSVFIKEGDIYTSIKDEEAKLNYVQSAPASKPTIFFSWHLKLWPRNVPFKIGASFSQKERKEILKSFQLISDVTCLRFHDYRSNDKHWIEFFKGKGCFSRIGRPYYQERAAARISLGHNCAHTAIIVHEVLHSLGFSHEQSRIDRDSFVRLYPNNILKRFHDQYDKLLYLQEYYADTPYDYNSIMHYSNKAFVNNYKANTIENKFDPMYELGSTVLSKIDIKEINARYQCNVKSGWSEWTPMSRCIANWRGECTKGSVRFCVSQNHAFCPGADEYGAQSRVTVCSKSECDATDKFKDGFWGKWGPYDKCSGSCGWGTQTRARRCDNPSPQYDGKECSGLSTMKHLCRRIRCGGASQFDLNLESGFGQWIPDGFTRQRGRASNENGGPNADHTSEVEDVQGWYGMAFHRQPKIATLKSPLVASYQGEKCFSFYYQLNSGKHLDEKRALSVYLEYKDGSTVNLPFAKGGHQGNYWKRAALKLKGMTQQFRIVFSAAFSWTKSIVAVDDVFFDHAPCGEGLEDCKDLDPKCGEYATKDYCTKYFRYALQKCCYTCSGPTNLTKVKTTRTPVVTIKPPVANCKEDTAKRAKNCGPWAETGYCTSKEFMSFMQTHCCKSCSQLKTTKTPTTTTTATTTTTTTTTTAPPETKKCTEIPYYKDKCPVWVKRGLCTSTISFWKDLMSEYCCRECGKVLPVKPEKPKTTKCVEIAEYKNKCPIWAKRGYCTSTIPFWKNLMRDHCCKDCLRYG